MKFIRLSKKISWTFSVRINQWFLLKIRIWTESLISMAQSILVQTRLRTSWDSIKACTDRVKLPSNNHPSRLFVTSRAAKFTTPLKSLGSEFWLTTACCDIWWWLWRPWLWFSHLWCFFILLVTASNRFMTSQLQSRQASETSEQRRLDASTNSCSSTGSNNSNALQAKSPN